jgi:hypothetical protein
MGRTPSCTRSLEVTDAGPGGETVRLRDHVVSTPVPYGLQIRRTRRRGFILLVLLIVIMAITVLGVGYLSQSGLELACGRNLLLRAQMDCLAESGLEHAKGLILHPQEVPQEYWTGEGGQRLDAQCRDYYDVNVVKLGECNYQIVSTAYQFRGSERIGPTALKGELRLDPCIAYWQGNDTVIPWQARIVGDVYSGGKLAVLGTVDGDVFAARTIGVWGRVSGHQQESAGSAPVVAPGLSPDDFDSYYYVQSRVYHVGILETGMLQDAHLRASAGNPGGVYCCRGDLRLAGHVEIDGLLVVKHDLTLQENCDVTIRSIKNFPALLVAHDLHMREHGQRLRVEGLAQVGHCIRMGNKVGNTVDITGALCLVAGGVEETAGGTLTIRVAPDQAAIQLWRRPETPRRWSPAGGAFFKRIERLP